MSRTLQGLVISTWQIKLSNEVLNVLLQNLTNLKLFDASWTNCEENLVVQSSSVQTLSLKGSNCVWMSIQCIKLNRLVIGCSKQLTEVQLNCPNIEKLDAQDCPLLTQKFTESISNRCPLIKTINISSCHGISSQAITALLATSLCLHLNISNHTNLSLLSIPTNHHLKFLSVRNCPSFVGLDVKDSSALIHVDFMNCKKNFNVGD